MEEVEIFLACVWRLIVVREIFSRCHLFFGRAGGPRQALGIVSPFSRGRAQKQAICERACSFVWSFLCLFSTFGYWFYLFGTGAFWTSLKASGPLVGKRESNNVWSMEDLFVKSVPIWSKHGEFSDWDGIRQHFSEFLHVASSSGFRNVRPTTSGTFADL